MKNAIVQAYHINLVTFWTDWLNFGGNFMKGCVIHDENISETSENSLVSMLASFWPAGDRLIAL